MKTRRSDDEDVFYSSEDRRFVPRRPRLLMTQTVVPAVKGVKNFRKSARMTIKNEAVLIINRKVGDGNEQRILLLLLESRRLIVLLFQFQLLRPAQDI